MIASAWSNGKGSFGLKITKNDRDQYFKQEWKCVMLEFKMNDKLITIEVNTNKKSFWNDTCHELINHKIGDYLRSIGCIPWIKGKPPKFNILLKSEKTFKVEKIA